MQFPLTISKNLGLFTVLRTVFTARRNQRKADEEPDYASAVLPLAFHENLAFNWSANKTGFGPAKLTSQPALSQIGTHDLYEYSLVFTLSGEYLAFKDASTVAVFRVHVTQKSCHVFLHRHIVKKGNRFLLGIGKFAMHPYLPLVLFGTPYSVFLWKFEPGMS